MIFSRLYRLNRLCTSRISKACINSVQYSKRASMTSKDARIADKMIFSDDWEIYKGKKFAELFRTFSVFQTCSTPLLVDNADKLLKWTYNVLPKSLADSLMKKSVYGHFVGGESPEDMQPRVNKLNVDRIGVILDYAAESDVGSADNGVDASCESSKESFIKCVKTARSIHKDPRYSPIIGVKVSAVAPPNDLVSLSRAITEWNRLFTLLSGESNKRIPKETFLSSFSSFFSCSEAESKAVYHLLDGTSRRYIDKSDWSAGFTIPQISTYLSRTDVATVKIPQSLVEVSNQIMTRLTAVCNEASHAIHPVKLFMDAEQTYFQPAIHYYVIQLSRQFNKPGLNPIIFNTHQMYLKDSFDQLVDDVDRAKRWNYRILLKMVRGAYIQSETNLASLNKISNPIWDTVQETHDNYDRGVAEILTRMSHNDQPIQLIIASHNKISIEKATGLMNKLKIPADDVSFGQLLGMCDSVTYELAKSGFIVYKLMPYGLVETVLAYIIRRLQENRGMLDRVREERNAVFREMKRRVWGEEIK